ncbi:MAG: hypothetical protein ACPG4N_10650, partial [Gammaproteobacteria bacterium]
GTWLPALVLAYMLRVTVSLPATLMAAGLLGALPILAAYVVLGDPAAWWRENLAVFATELGNTGAVDPKAVDQMLEVLAANLTGGIGLMLALWSMASLLVARYWQALLFNPGGFKAEFLALRLGRIATLGIAAVTAAGLLTGLMLIIDLSRPLAVVFAFQAAAVAHTAVELKRMHRGLLMALYVGVALLTTPLLHLMVLFGMVDNWLDVRGRLSASRA